MKLFSDCNECWTCACGNGCLAGIGDDDYIPADASTIIDRLDKNTYPERREEMKAFLKNRYNIEYDHCDITSMLLNSMAERNIVIEVQNRLLDKELKLINSINTQIVDTQGNLLIEIPNDSWYVSSNGNMMFEFRGYMFVLKPPLNNHGTYFLDQVFCKIKQ